MLGEGNCRNACQLLKMLRAKEVGVDKKCHIWLEHLDELKHWRLHKRSLNIVLGMRIQVKIFYKNWSKVGKVVLIFIKDRKLYLILY